MTSIAPSSRANSKYANVRPKVSSGASETARQRKWEESSSYANVKPNEKFR